MAETTHFRCPTCGPHVAADEEHTCGTCGRDCTVEPCPGHVCGEALAAAQAPPQTEEAIAYRISGTEDTGLVSVDYRSAWVDAEGVAASYRRDGLANVRVDALVTQAAAAITKGVALTLIHAATDELNEGRADARAATAELLTLRRDLAELQAVRNVEAETLRAVRGWFADRRAALEQWGCGSKALAVILNGTPLAPSARSPLVALAAAEARVARFLAVDPLAYDFDEGAGVGTWRCPGCPGGAPHDRRSFIHATTCPWFPSAESDGGAGERLDVRRVPTNYRRYVEAFGAIMLEKLNRNARKGSWKTCTRDYLLRRIQEEVSEVRQAVSGKVLDGQALVRELADVANFCLMLADVTGGLPVSGPQPTGEASDAGGQLADDREGR